MTKEDDDDNLPDKDAAKEFYAKYEPKEIIGRGISSTVRRCVEKESGKAFAAKIIDLSNESQENVDGFLMRDATRQEISILRLVMQHPYIIELHDVFESETFIFLVFELCKNGELFDYLTSVVTLSEKKTRYIMRQLFEGVQFIHSRNVVHRDLKPENILLDDELNVKITDFGFARVLQPGEKLFELCGTPGYLAPETLRANMFEDSPGYAIDVDVWACGVIMYTLLVGCPPFWHRKQMVMLRNIMEGKYSFESPEWEDISEEPKDLIRRLLVVEPENRISIEAALKHPFFHTILFDQDMIPLKKSFAAQGRRMSRIEQLTISMKRSSRQRLRAAISAVRAVVRLRNLASATGPQRMHLSTATQDPYHLKTLRKVIDGCAFRIYGHWVKKGEGQNRAALFENTPKIELKSLYVNNLSR